MKKILTAIVGFFSLITTQTLLAQDASEIAIKNMVDSQRFEFVAQVAIPMGGRSKNLDYGYDLRIKKDTVIAYLPYYGRSYSAGYGDTGSGIDFTSHNFKYSKEDAKKGGWTITISPKDVKDPSQELVLTVSVSGTAYLTVSSNSRQNISFNGFIKEIKQK